MANILPSFLSGAQLVVRLGNSTSAFCQAISFSHNMGLAPVGGLGAANYHTLEPVQYSAQGSVVITRYSRQLAAESPNGVFGIDGSSTPLPINGSKNDTINGKPARGGNSLLLPRHFNPVRLIISQTFDITVHLKNVKANDVTELGPILYTLQNCRATGWSTGLNPGSLMNETLSFICLRVKDHSVEA